MVCMLLHVPGPLAPPAVGRGEHAAVQVWEEVESSSSASWGLLPLPHQIPEDHIWRSGPPEETEGGWGIERKEEMRVIQRVSF